MPLRSFLHRRTTLGRHPQRDGVTLIEILVVIGILGLLVALILPAVQNTREAARKTQCLSHVRQLGLALGQYADLHSIYPYSGGMDEASIFVRALPFMEQEPLYSKFDLSRPMSQQVELMKQRPAVLACPSDPLVGPGGINVSYRGNAGWFIIESHAPPLPPRYRLSGVITLQPPDWDQVGPKHVTDGLSNTVILSECLPSDFVDHRRSTWDNNPSRPPPGRHPDIMASECLAATVISFWPTGRAWATGALYTTLYDHVLPPNSRTCLDSITAASAHAAGGVNTAFCDGSARFVTSGIDIAVWRALGTRSGKEVVEAQ